MIAAARTQAALAEGAAGTGNIAPEVADATDPTAAGRLIDRHDARVLVLVAGATPVIRPLQEPTWETFSAPWQVDVQIAFRWLREALVQPLAPASRVVVISSVAPR